MLIRDSVAVVTGASRGIGRATALMLGAAGGKVVVNARTRSEALEQVAKPIAGERAEVAEGDVADFAACGRIVRTATDRFGPVDILVNNAGNFALKNVVTMKPRDWESIFQVHVFGAFNMIRHVLPAMIQRKRGVIVNIASIVEVRQPRPGRVPYAAAKSALIGLTRALGLVVAPDPVRVVVAAARLPHPE